MKDLNIKSKRMREIEKVAYKTLEENGYSLDDSVDITALANDLGFMVGEAELNDGLDGFIIFDKKNIVNLKSSKIIGINKDLPVEEKRFTIAHEIGHYILQAKDLDASELPFACREHRNRSQKTGISEQKNNENEMDFFAACLLMPKSAVEKHLKKKISGKNNNIVSIVQSVADTFCVSVECSLYRLYELELLNNLVGR